MSTTLLSLLSPETSLKGQNVLMPLINGLAYVPCAVTCQSAINLEDDNDEYSDIITMKQRGLIVDEEIVILKLTAKEISSIGINVSDGDGESKLVEVSKREALLIINHRNAPSPPPAPQVKLLPPAAATSKLELVKPKSKPKAPPAPVFEIREFYDSANKLQSVEKLDLPSQLEELKTALNVKKPKKDDSDSDSDEDVSKSKIKYLLDGLNLINDNPATDEDIFDANNSNENPRKEPIVKRTQTQKSTRMDELIRMEEAHDKKQAKADEKALWEQVKSGNGKTEFGGGGLKKGFFDKSKSKSKTKAANAPETNTSTKKRITFSTTDHVKTIPSDNNGRVVPPLLGSAQNNKTQSKTQRIVMANEKGNDNGEFDNISEYHNDVNSAKSDSNNSNSANSGEGINKMRDSLNSVYSNEQDGFYNTTEDNTDKGNNSNNNEEGGRKQRTIPKVNVVQEGVFSGAINERAYDDGSSRAALSSTSSSQSATNTNKPKISKFKLARQGLL